MYKMNNKEIYDYREAAFAYNLPLDAYYQLVHSLKREKTTIKVNSEFLKKRKFKL